MKLPLLLAGAVFTTTAAFAGTDVEYSTAEYCALSEQLKGSISHQHYLNAYAKKLGQTPAKETCQQIRSAENFQLAVTEDKWNYRFNKPYRGSAIRLSTVQIEKLRRANVQSTQIFELLGANISPRTLR